MSQSRSFQHDAAVSDWVRGLRSVSESGSRSGESELTIFVGLYNAENYWTDVIQYLESQTYKKCTLLLVDNASNDQTWGLVKSWLPAGFRHVVKVRNPANMGGAGSLFANLDLVKTEWVLTCHQDDWYYPNHFESHARMIRSASDRTAMVTTSMDSLGTAGHLPKPLPRANWISSQRTSTDVFLTHLRFHSLPFPAASFRKKALASVDIPWHDTSFPDTEIVLRLAGAWDFMSDSKCTMAYRENPKSESHVITDKQRRVGQARALIRVFQSESFKGLLRSLEAREWDDFFRHAEESIDLRLGGLEQSRDVKLALAESFAVSLNYGCLAANTFIAEAMHEQGNVFGENFFAFKTVPDAQPGHASSANLGSSKLNHRSNGHTGLTIVRALLRFGFVAAYKLGLLKNRRDLDFEWRRKK